MSTFPGLCATGYMSSSNTALVNSHPFDSVVIDFKSLLITCALFYLNCSTEHLDVSVHWNLPLHAYFIIFGVQIFNELSSPPLQKKTGVVKVQEKKERWKEKKVAKRQKKDDEEVEEEEENVQPVVDALENGFLHHAQREQERMNERLLKKTYSKKNKMVSVSASVVKEMSAMASDAMNDRGANQLLRWHMVPLFVVFGLKVRSSLFSKYVSIHSVL